MPIIDVDGLYGSLLPVSRGENREELLVLLDRFGIDRIILASALAVKGDFQRGNAELHQLLEGQSKLRGYVTVNAHYPEESIAEVRRYLSRSNFVGTRFYPADTRLRLAAEGSRRVLSALRRFGRPIFVVAHTEEEVRDTVTIAQEFTTLPFILGHLGEELWEMALGAVEEVLNIHLAVGGIHADRDKIKEAIELVGPRRLMFGSGLPVLHPAYAAGMVHDAGIPNPHKERVFYRNAQGLFGLRVE
ncbi:MAG TPA: hypothetical protein EYP85_13955 [Armatimonadetes bacterium]|nr:hypothetical protein [Armatimonadota bacterium]